MFNRERTKEVFIYDIDPLSGRSQQERDIAQGRKRYDLPVVDNCPDCDTERHINYKQSMKNKPCSKCFHATPEMVEAKKNQKKEKSEETKQKMRENHWSKNGGISAFKGKTHTQEVKTILAEKTAQYYEKTPKEEYGERYIKGSCTQRGISVEEFNGFSAPEGTRIRQSAEGKAWSYDVLAKGNFTCDNCDIRGGKLHAHHLNAFNAFPEQRFDVDNGVCLCETCHDEFHVKYGKGYNTREQYQEFRQLDNPLSSV